MWSPPPTRWTHEKRTPKRTRAFDPPSKLARATVQRRDNREPERWRRWQPVRCHPNVTLDTTGDARVRPNEGIYEGSTDAWLFEGTQACTEKTSVAIVVTHAGS